MDKDAKLSAARFFREETTKAVWETFSRMRENTYIGFPDTITTYHAFLRQNNKIIKMDYPNTKPNMTLSISIKICNDTSRINGLTPTLLVFGIIHRMPIKTEKLPLQRERMRSIKGEREKMTRMTSLDRIKTVLARNFPSAANSDLIKGMEVLMYREKPVCKWIVPYVTYKRV